MSSSGQRRRLYLGAVAAAAIAIALLCWFTDALGRSELDTVDARFAVRGTENPPDDLVVVEIDDVSFDALQQRWPLPRSLHGRLIEVLSDAGAAAIVYEVQFTEPTEPAEDEALVGAVADSRAPVVLATEETDEQGRSGVFGGDRVLDQIGARAGHSAFDPDPGGVFRRFDYSTGGLESLSVAAVEQRDGVQVDPGDFPDDGAWIDYAGPPGTIPSHSFSRVIGGKVDPEAFKGKTVVVGVSAPTVQDVHPVSTSDDELMPGAEIQANAIATVENGLDLGDASWPFGALAIVLLGSVVPAAGLRWPPLAAAGAGLLAGLLYLVIAPLAFNAGTILPLLYPLLALAIAIVGTLAVHYLFAAFERQRARLMFERFVPPGVVDEVMGRADDDLRLGSQKRVCTVMFSDVRGFTTIAESRGPDQVLSVLNRYLGEMTDAIMGHGGTLVSYMGDGIMAVFGAPLDQPDHADRALAAAREMLEVRLSAVNEAVLGKELDERFEIGVGLHSGEVMTGQVGSERRVEYTAIGDTVNTASRLEGLTKGTPHALFLSSATVEMLTDPSGLEAVDTLEVRGRREPIEVWTLTSAEARS
ncbi:MAG: adenylate/guanylate cyclase domain-containing protein [Actinobacteria bacterium]|nr:adenylate/guanylate cyclase domain-containing protein [Actinomycetota bacterium]